MTVYEKADLFLKALLSVFESEENKSTEDCQKITSEDSDEEDFTAMMLAMKELFDPENKIDLVDFTHVLNKLAVEQTMFECCCACYEEHQELAELAVADSTTKQ